MKEMCEIEVIRQCVLTSTQADSGQNGDSAGKGGKNVKDVLVTLARVCVR